MIPFEQVQIQHKQMITDCYFHDGKQNSEYSFANLFMWGRQEFAMVAGCVCVFSHWGDRSIYLYPVGGDVRTALEALMDDATARGIPLRMHGLDQTDLKQLDTWFPGQFFWHTNRDSFDYVYDIARLAELNGRKLQQKRNHIHRFEEAYPDWLLEDITPELLAECSAMVDDWYQVHGAEDYGLEAWAIRRCFENFEAIGMEGLILRGEPGGKILALTMGNRTSPDTFDVNFEKAYSDINGAYPLINRSFARYLQAKYPELRFLNREDDMGLPGLRKAKESYHPDILAEKYSAIWLGK